MKILPNGIAVVEGDSHISRWVEETGQLCHDGTVTGYIVPLIPEGGTVIDAGANIGDHTIEYAKKVGPNGRVLALEPNIEAFQCLVHNMEPYSWVNAGGVALHSSMGFMMLQTDTANIGASWCHPTENRSGAVPCITIDSLILPRLDFIKLDIEGGEYAALQGASFTLKHHRPIIVCEVNRGALERAGSTPEQLIELIAGYGYRIERLCGGQDDAQYDIVARPMP